MKDSSHKMRHEIGSEKLKKRLARIRKERFLAELELEAMPPKDFCRLHNIEYNLQTHDDISATTGYDVKVQAFRKLHGIV